MFTESEGDSSGLKTRRTGDSVKKPCSRVGETIFCESIMPCKETVYVNESWWGQGKRLPGCSGTGT